MEASTPSRSPSHMVCMLNTRILQLPHKFRDPCPSVKEGFDHEPVVTPFAVRGLNQPPHLVFIEPHHGATALPRSRELQRASHLLDDIAALIVREVMLTPELDGLVGLAVVMSASIMGSATLGSPRRTEGRGWQFDRCQNRRKHRPRLLAEKPLRCSRPVRPREEKVVNGRQALPLARQVPR